MDDVNKKNVNNRNDISDIDPPLMVGDFFPMVLLFKGSGDFKANQRAQCDNDENVKDIHARA